MGRRDEYLKDRKTGLAVVTALVDLLLLKTLTKSAIGEDRFISVSVLRSITEGGQGQKLKAETMEEAACCLADRFCLAGFLI